MATVNCGLVTAKHVQEALDYIATKGTPMRRASRSRYIVYKGNRFAPKWLFAVAYSIAIGKDKADAESIIDYTTSQILPTLRKLASEVGYEVILENDEKDLSEMTTQERREAFKKWMGKVAKKQDGGRFEKNTIGTYFTSLNTLGEQLKERGLYSKEVFEIYDADEIDEITQILKDSHVLTTFFKDRNQSGNLASALSQYKKFLQYEFEVVDDEDLALTIDWNDDFKAKEPFLKTKPISVTFPNRAEIKLKDWLNLPNEIITYLLSVGHTEGEIQSNYPFKPQTSGTEKIPNSNLDKIVDLNQTCGVLRWCKELLGKFKVDLSIVVVKYRRLKLSDSETTDMDEVAKFKQLLAWFVKQVKINNGIMEGASTSGAGYKGHKIRDFYKEWRSYKGFELDCAIQAGYQKASTNNYVHLTLSWLNIIPKFIKVGDKSDVCALQIVIKKEGNLIERDYPEKTLTDLDLLSDAPPNGELQAFFELFKDEIKRHQKENGTDGESEGGLAMKGENVIFYGVPGSGKSYSIKGRINAIGKGDYESLESENIVKVVFHPDYTYSDFTGQILPSMNDSGQVEYSFKPGPFTSVMKLAIENPDDAFILVIEEINRGNAAAIFGDIFQLLDRKKNGESEYEIVSPDIAKEIYGDKTKRIRIPNNLWLYATMNTSDQNVFTLDTAFQRRWDMELVENKFDDEKHSFKIGLYNSEANTGITWKAFATKVNEILATQDGVMSSEDKSLGAWFIQPDSADEQTVSGKRFANKVLKYLWDDAFKFDRKAFFDTDKFKTLEQVLDAFKALKADNGLGEISREFRPTSVTQDDKAE